MLYSWRFSRYSTPIHWLVHGHMTSNNETDSRQMPWAGNIAKTMTSNGKQFTVTREMSTAVARDRWNLSAVFKFSFFFVLLYNKSLNDWSLGEQSLSVKYLLKASTVKCWTIPLINTLKRYSINNSVDTRSTSTLSTSCSTVSWEWTNFWSIDISRPTLSRLSTDCWSSVDGVSTKTKSECHLRCLLRAPIEKILINTHAFTHGPR